MPPFLPFPLSLLLLIISLTLCTCVTTASPSFHSPPSPRQIYFSLFLLLLPFQPSPERGQREVALSPSPSLACPLPSSLRSCPFTPSLSRPRISCLSSSPSFSFSSSAASIAKQGKEGKAGRRAFYCCFSALLLGGSLCRNTGSHIFSPAERVWGRCCVAASSSTCYITNRLLLLHPLGMPASCVCASPYVDESLTHENKQQSSDGRSDPNDSQPTLA